MRKRNLPEVRHCDGGALPVTSHHLAVLAAAALSGLIAGVAVTAIVMWFARDRIRARMIRKRGG